ncbi:glycoside hydrolase family 2 protein [Flagellimonas allohymeniacidonis]|nr:glycoside hydrolase family 2 TIM barrel-domain containing protein [Allomuricauda hymeniacidonis]
MGKRLFFLLGLATAMHMNGQRTLLSEWTFFTEKDSALQTITVPHTWNLKDAFDDEPGYWRGKGIYETTFEVNDLEQAYFLHFEGVNQEAKIFINGKYAGIHLGGYTAFDIDASDLLEIGENDLKVEVTNAHDDTIPPLDADFTFFGGIYRAVYLEMENAVHFQKRHGADNIKIDALLDETLKKGTVQIHGSVTNPQKDSLWVAVSLYDNIDGHPVYSTQFSIVDTLQHRYGLNLPKLWSPELPNLYHLTIELSDGARTIDTYEHQIGFRKFEANTSGFILNNQPLKLLGVNRHQDFHGYGNAVPLDLQLKDLATIKEMGSNFLRLAHYPQSKEIYEAADSLGLILWSEIPVVNKVPIGDDFDSYSNNSIAMQTEHIAQNYNHPSLIFLGYMNEIFLRMVFDRLDEKTEEAIISNTLDLATDLEQLTRNRAPNHITVMALHGNSIYNETGIADIAMVIGWNLYKGWYEGKIFDLGPFLDLENQKFPNRPLIISEYGVGADPRIRSEIPKKFDFSEAYQLEYHLGYMKQILERDYVMGATVWNFADFASEFRGDALPHINQKGLVNYDRTPKNTFHWYKAVLDSTNQHIRFFRDSDRHDHSSNQREIEVIANRAFRLQANDSEYLFERPQWGVSSQTIYLREGKNVLKLYDKEGTLTDYWNIDYKKPNLNKLGDRLNLNLGTDIEFLSKDGTLWIPIKNTSNVTTVGKVSMKKIATNIRGTTNDPIYQSQLINIEKMVLEVPEGDYEVLLHFSRFGNENELIFELGKNTNPLRGDLAQQLYVNDKQVEVPPLGTFQWATKRILVPSAEKLEVKANPRTTISLAGISIMRLR